MNNDAPCKQCSSSMASRSAVRMVVVVSSVKVRHRQGSNIVSVVLGTVYTHFLRLLVSVSAWMHFNLTHAFLGIIFLSFSVTSPVTSNGEAVSSLEPCLFFGIRVGQFLLVLVTNHLLERPTTPHVTHQTEYHTVVPVNSQAPS